MKLRPTARADCAFLRRWAMVLAPAGILVGLAAWVLPDSTVHAPESVFRLGGLVAIFFWCVLPDRYSRLRRGGLIYLLGLIVYGLIHNLRWWILGQ